MVVGSVILLLLIACNEDPEPWADTLERLRTDCQATGLCPSHESIDLGARELVDDLDPDTSLDRSRRGLCIFLGFRGTRAPCQRTYGTIGVNQAQLLGVYGQFDVPGLVGVNSAEVDLDGALLEGMSSGWLCLESLVPPAPESLRATSGAAIGSWLLRYDDVVLFDRFKEASCIGVEDAGISSHEEDGYDHSYQCNGEDDDLDGLIDEGAQDCDEDGVPDCLQGIEAEMAGGCPTL